MHWYESRPWPRSRRAWAWRMPPRGSSLSRPPATPRMSARWRCAFRRPWLPSATRRGRAPSRSTAPCRAPDGGSTSAAGCTTSTTTCPAPCVVVSPCGTMSGAMPARRSTQPLGTTGRSTYSTPADRPFWTTNPDAAGARSMNIRCFCWPSMPPRSRIRCANTPAAAWWARKAGRWSCSRMQTGPKCWTRCGTTRGGYCAG